MTVSTELRRPDSLLHFTRRILHLRRAHPVLGRGSFLLRSTAGSISLVVVLLFVLLIPLGLAASKWEWVRYITEVLPSSSAAAVADPYNLLETTTKLDYGAVIASGYAWAIIPMIIAFFVFSKRDA